MTEIKKRPTYNDVPMQKVGMYGIYCHVDADEKLNEMIKEYEKENLKKSYCYICNVDAKEKEIRLHSHSNFIHVCKDCYEFGYYNKYFGMKYYCCELIRKFRFYTFKDSKNLKYIKNIYIRIENSSDVRDYLNYCRLKIKVKELENQILEKGKYKGKTFKEAYEDEKYRKFSCSYKKLNDKEPFAIYIDARNDKEEYKKYKHLKEWYNNNIKKLDKYVKKNT